MASFPGSCVGGKRLGFEVSILYVHVVSLPSCDVVDWIEPCGEQLY